MKDKIKLLSLFSGIGAFEKALTNLGVKYELVGFSEIDKWAIDSYCRLHDVDKSLNLGDIRNIQSDHLPKDIDMITHGSPCQDFSIAGKGKGGDKGSGTRSSLMWETVRIISDIKPKIVIWENVRSVLFKSNIDNFNKYLKVLEEMGYINDYEVLNSKDFNIAQNRNRVFVVSVLKEEYRDWEIVYPGKDKDLCIELFLKPRVEVPDKYFYDENEREFIYTNEELDIPTQKLHHVAYFTYPNSKKRHQSNTFYDTKGLCPTIDTASGGNLEPKILDDGYFRKLTPRECWRLMGFTEQDFRKVQGQSDTQLYKQAGNSIVVQVLEGIYKGLIKGGII